MWDVMRMRRRDELLSELGIDPDENVPVEISEMSNAELEELLHDDVPVYLV